MRKTQKAQTVPEEKRTRKVQRVPEARNQKKEKAKKEPAGKRPGKSFLARRIKRIRKTRR